MYIKKAEKPQQGHMEEFIAMDDLGKRLGRATLSGFMNEMQMPLRPYELTVQVHGHNEAWPQLVAAATVSAMVAIRGRDPQVPSRVLAPCGARNHVYLQLLRSIGYQNDDALVRMRRGDILGSSTAHPPQGTLLIRDTLDDPAERRFFLARCQKLFGMADPEAWLSDKTALGAFQRLLLAADDGLTGEALCWLRPDGPGEVGVIYTAPNWRRKGAGLCLMEAARVHLSQHGAQEIVYDVRKRNVAATQLGYSAGYRPGETLMLLPGIDL